MLRRLFLFFSFFGFVHTVFAQEITSPEKFLGYKLGEQFTPHQKIVDYFKYISKASKNVKLVQYGTSSEGRPLEVMFVASDENIGRVEEIRKNNLRLAGLETAPNGSGVTTIKNSYPVASLKTPVIVWLSFNVHGNEPASSETAMQVLFDMVDPQNSQAKEWLKNTLLIIDPCLNPDGRERYVSFYNSVKGAQPDANPYAREHAEPWPGGRFDHYYFDLNRDWAWGTQKETIARVALYNQWLPQIHVDFHEQGYNAPYYFAPAANPIHKDITHWQMDFQFIIGKNNAKYFDQKGWLYFSKEEFDLLYPSYGDTYPIYNGAIGMTYEQGGIGAGLSVYTKAGDTLTLAQRIAHHHTTALSTIETASQYSEKLVNEFKKFYDDSQNEPPGDFKSYIIKNENSDKINKLSKLLERNGIQYGFGLKATATGFNYNTEKTEQFTIAPNDMVISAYQPKAVLLHVLLEQKTIVADSDTYDITAWSLPYAYGLGAYGVKEPLKPVTQTPPPPPEIKPVSGPRVYAYVIEWKSVNDVKFLAVLLKKGIKVKFSEKPFEAAGKKFSAGTLLITRAGNEFEDFEKEITQTAAALNEDLTPLSTGFVEKGADFGSNIIRAIRRPRIMLITGDATFADAMGELWYYFDQQINYAPFFSQVKYQDLAKVSLRDVDVIILPNGIYADFPLEKIQNWIKDGGKLIAIEKGIDPFAGKKGFGIKKKEEKADDKADAKAKDKPFMSYADRERDALSETVPGAIFKVNLDNTHPLGFGFPTWYYSLKQNEDIYDFLGEDGWNVGTIKKDAHVSGFVGQKSLAKVKDGLLLGVQNIGRGSIVYMVDDPIFRSFWENGKLLLGNAVFMVGQ